MGLAAENSRVDPQQVRQELRQILSAREYDHSLNSLDRFVTRIGQWIRDLGLRILGWFIEHLTLKGSSFGEIIATLASWLAVVAFLVLAFFVVRKLLRDGRRQDRASGGDG